MSALDVTISLRISPRSRWATKTRAVPTGASVARTLSAVSRARIDTAPFISGRVLRQPSYRRTRACTCVNSSHTDVQCANGLRIWRFATLAAEAHAPPAAAAMARAVALQRATVDAEDRRRQGDAAIGGLEHARDVIVDDSLEVELR